MRRRSRKGQGRALELIGETVVVLIVIAILIWLLSRAGNPFRKLGDCERAGGVCVPSDVSCGNEGKEDYNRAEACEESYGSKAKCCIAFDESDAGYQAQMSRKYDKPEILVYRGESLEPITRTTRIIVYPQDTVEFKVAATRMNEKGERLDASNKPLEEEGGGIVTYNCDVRLLHEDKTLAQIEGKDAIFSGCKNLASETRPDAKDLKTTVSYTISQSDIYQELTLQASIFRGNAPGENPDDMTVNVILDVQSPVKINVNPDWSNKLLAAVECKGITCTNIEYGWSTDKTCENPTWLSGGLETLGNNKYNINHIPFSGVGPKPLGEGEIYVCIKAITSSKEYIIPSQQQVRIDYTPPVAKVSFDPFPRMEISFACEDTGSGCDYTGDGYAYIGDMVNFIGALLNGVRDPKWCPQEQGRYLPVAEKLLFSGPNQAQLICYMAKDHAGNIAFDIEPVYSIVSLLQTLIDIKSSGDCEKQGYHCSASCAGGQGFPLGCSSGKYCCIS